MTLLHDFGDLTDAVPCQTSAETHVALRPHSQCMSRLDLMAIWPIFTVLPMSAPTTTKPVTAIVMRPSIPNLCSAFCHDLSLCPVLTMHVLCLNVEGFGTSF